RAAFVTPTDLTNGNTLSPGTLRLAGAADFDVDGDPDLLFYDNQSGQLQAWFMTGTGRKAFNLIKEHATQLPLSFSSPWRVGALGDFNADGLIDIAFQNVTTGEIQVWFMGGTDRTGYTSVKNQTTQATIFAPSPWMLNTAG